MRPALARTFGWALAALALLGTFALYDRPEFLMNLADQLWSCF